MTVKVAFKGQRLSKVALCPSCPPESPLPYVATHFGGWPLTSFHWTQAGTTVSGIPSGSAGFYIQFVFMPGGDPAGDWKWSFQYRNNSTHNMVVPAESWYYQSPTNQFSDTAYINADSVKVLDIG